MSVEKNNTEIIYSKDFPNNVKEYVKNMESKIKKIIDLTKTYRYKFTDGIVDLYDMEEDKVVLKGRYDIIGIYNTNNMVWYWGWNLDMVDRLRVRKSRNVKNISKSIKGMKHIEKIDEEYYFRTGNGNFNTTLKTTKELCDIYMYINNDKLNMVICHGKNGKSLICHPLMLLKEDKQLLNSIEKLEFISINEIIQHT